MLSLSYPSLFTLFSHSLLSLFSLYSLPLSLPQRATDEIKRVAGDLSFLCISADGDKLTVFAYATDAAVAQAGGGVKANDWVSRTLQAVGGRGGGKPGMAQGSVGAADAATVSKAREAAQKYLQEVA